MWPGDGRVGSQGWGRWGGCRGRVSVRLTGDRHPTRDGGKWDGDARPMILVFDVGNTETTVRLFDGVVLRKHWRLTTVPERTPDELAIVIVQLLRFANADTREIEGAAIASVVPAITGPLGDACRALTARRAIVVNGGSPLPIRLGGDGPLTGGAGRVIH